MDDITMCARKDIHPGEEITYDYSTTESYIDPEMEEVKCRCLTPVCRGRINATDWQRSELQARYGVHWMSYLVDKIAAHRLALARQELPGEGLGLGLEQEEEEEEGDGEGKGKGQSFVSALLVGAADDDNVHAAPTRSPAMQHAAT